MSLWVAGCGGPGLPSAEFPPRGTVTRPPKTETNAPNAIVTPGGSLPGKVVLVNTTARFVVLSFPMGGVPAPDRRLNVYRDGLKVGVIKITGPQRDQNTVADIISGECQVGDEIKDD